MVVKCEICGGIGQDSYAWQFGMKWGRFYCVNDGHIDSNGRPVL